MPEKERNLDRLDRDDRGERRDLGKVEHHRARCDDRSDDPALHQSAEQVRVVERRVHHADLEEDVRHAVHFLLQAIFRAVEERGEACWQQDHAGDENHDTRHEHAAMAVFEPSLPGIHNSISALSRHRRRHARCAGIGVPVLKMTATERRSF